MIERALELARRRAQGAEITLSTRRSTSAEYEDDKLKRVGVSQASHLGVRVIVNGKLGSAHSTDPGDAEAVVARAVELAEFGSEAKFEFPGPAAGPEVKTYDEGVPQTPKEDLVAAGAEMRDLVKAYNPEVKVFADAYWSVAERRLINSSGLDISDRGSAFGMDAGGMLVRGTDMLQAWASRDWRRKETAPREVAQRAIEKFRLAERTAPLASKSMPVILTHAAGQILLMAVVMGISGKNVLKGESPLAGRLGERLAPAAFSLLDDATIDYAPASGRHDGEGVPRRKTEIITKGALASFIYDLDTAGKAGAASTGHGPGCQPSNVIIPPGSASLDEMVKSIDEGLLVDHVLGLGQSNIMNGDFSVNVSLGYKIENGEIVGRVKDAMLAGNAYDAMKRIEAIASEPEWIGTLCVPPVKIGGLSVVAGG